MSSCCKQQNIAQTAVSQLTPYQQGVLDLFFRLLLMETSVGYTLYGNKPVSHEGFKPEHILLLRSDHRWARMGCLWKEGLRVWQESGLCDVESNYKMFMPNRMSYGWGEITCVNVHAFLNTVQKNWSLFQYILGPKITADALCKQFQNSDENLESIFHGNRVFNGIMLGYGTNNALLGSRYEYLTEYLMGIEQPHDLSIRSHEPSFGFSSIDQELTTLKNNEIITTTYESPKPRLPWFASFPSDESNQILAEYQNVQKTLQRVLDSSDFLGAIFSRLFETHVVTTKCQPIIELLNSKLKNQQQLSKMLGQAIWLGLLAGNRNEAPTSDDIDVFVQGMNEIEANQSISGSLAEAKSLVMNCNSSENCSQHMQECLRLMGQITWHRYKNLSHLISFDEVLNGLQEAASGEMLEINDRLIEQLELLSWLYSGQLCG